MSKNAYSLKQLGGSIEKSILYNRAVLYFIFFLTLGYLFFLIIQTDYYTFAIFILIGFLTSFFSKNMIVILSLALSVSFIFKYGTKIRPEGFEEEKEGFQEGALTLDDMTNMTPAKATKLAEKYQEMIEKDGKITVEMPVDKNLFSNMQKEIMKNNTPPPNTTLESESVSAST